jgi:hypothetical protein
VLSGPAIHAGYSGTMTTMCLALWSLTADPVPPVPDEELNNFAAVDTVQNNPHLFRITTPIKVDKLEALLADHKNPLLVESVCASLRTSFWPKADTHYHTYPVTWDNSHWSIRTQAKEDFISAQIQKEVATQRYSEDFGPELLPGMYCSPIHTVPKPETDTLWLINNQSAGEFSPNSMISCEDIAWTCMDGIKSLRVSLHTFCQEYGDVELIMHKSKHIGTFPCHEDHIMFTCI